MTASLIRFTGAYDALSPEDRLLMMSRGQSRTRDVSGTVSGIISRVRSGGDAALRMLAEELDRIPLETIEVSREEISRALERAPVNLREALERSARNIAAFHASQLPSSTFLAVEPGIVLHRRADPLSRVGVYAPGGRAAYPSSVLMGAIPAKVAGVPEVILCSPPEKSGLPNSSVLAAASIARVDRVFAVGGAGAVAAMAFGTSTIPRVNKIVGPGNAYVAEAKLQLAHAAGFDSPAGPSELLVIVDETADPRIVVREMLAQAEHDPLAAVIAVTIGPSMAATIRDLLIAEMPKALRSDIIAGALSQRGAVISVGTLPEAVAISNAFAPEHLLLATSNAESLLAEIRNAGTVFVGESSSVAFGDYMTGANHVLPTGGLARSYSGLSTSDFMRWTTFQTIAPSAAARLSADTAVFADAEGLHAHAEAARAWTEGR
jgi:histidinol dehydrogenase